LICKPTALDILWHLALIVHDGNYSIPLWLKLGDTVEIEISGIGLLRNPVAAE
jgi:2-keto-4-pentenoate hydratase/2-oxohepta-3-ene-1,7-dioic acid hydratase in catechol pathway